MYAISRAPLHIHAIQLKTLTLKNAKHMYQESLANKQVSLK
jgi:hypothetical protein